MLAIRLWFLQSVGQVPVMNIELNYTIVIWSSLFSCAICIEMQSKDEGVLEFKAENTHKPNNDTHQKHIHTHTFTLREKHSCINACIKRKACSFNVNTIVELTLLRPSSLQRKLQTEHPNKYIVTYIISFSFSFNSCVCFQLH